MRILAYAATALSVMVVGAAADPIADRKQNMRERGAQMQILGPIAQGQRPFDGAAVMAALQVLSENAAKGADLDTYWPDGSDAGDTRSQPSVWSDRAGYQAASDKYKNDIDAAIAANPQDVASFQAAFGAVAANCGACHQVYRK